LVLAISAGDALMVRRTTFSTSLPGPGFMIMLRFLALILPP
jgi:hypothetical protein